MSTKNKSTATVEAPALPDFSKELETITTTSGKIRLLNSKGIARGSIAKTLGIRYQHVRNVLEMPVKNPKK